MAGFLDVITPVTIANYALGAWDGVSRHNPTLGYLRKEADWEFDVGGDHMEGAVEGGRIKPIISAPGMDLTTYIKPLVRYARWSLTWGEITSVLPIDVGALRRNSGPQALVKLKEKEVPAMIRDTLYGVDGLLHQFLNQNITIPTGTNASAGLPIAGLPSLLLPPAATGLEGCDGNTGNITYTGVAVAATDKEATPGASSQTYATLSMKHGALTGVDNAEVDAWTPTLVNSSSTAWNGAASPSANIGTICQWAANRARRVSSTDPDKRPQLGLLSYDYFQYLGAKITAAQTIHITGGNENASTKVTQPSLGTIDDVLPYAGLLWRWDERMPAKCGYVLNFRQIFARVQSLYKDLQNNSPSPLTKTGEDAGILETAITWDPIRRQWITTCTAPLQILANPRYQVRIGEYA